MLSRRALLFDEIPHELADDLGRGPVCGLRFGHELLAQLRFQLQGEHRLLRHDGLLGINNVSTTLILNPASLACPSCAESWQRGSVAQLVMPILAIA